MQYLATGIRCLMMTVFLGAVVGKVATRASFKLFVTSVREMRLLPETLARPAALLVVATESAVCALLAFPFRAAVSVGFAVATALLAVFTVGVLLVSRRQVRVSCRCFGASSTPLSARHVFRNALLVALAAVAAVAVAAGWADGPTDPGGSVLAVCAGTLLGLLIVSLDNIVDLFRTEPKTPGVTRERR
ncbi:hypothetical protein OG598_04535 [Micromonospora sp. NBC_00330]|uniref:MauE/DoxX family redox-associated membrane protein n=1 Tax=Micromonospora sp. NBC_00330 TaxID=2903585 RepID=UPI002E2CB9A6|nr:MauE/DoxX family redox-associated membrane protein [Micromonospora sp. NBC_00330]